jgi:hypothetical protein
MRKAEAKQFWMVEGEVVRGSAGMWATLIVFGGVIALAGAGVLLSGWTELSVWGFVLVESPRLAGVLTVLVGLVLVSIGVYKLMEGGRLILGADRLQFVTARGRVLTQIPYRNISAAKLVEVKMEDTGIVVKRIHIDLHDFNDPETLIPQRTIYREHHGCDCMFEPAEFVLASQELHDRIQTHLEKFRTRVGAPSPPG